MKWQWMMCGFVALALLGLCPSVRAGDEVRVVGKGGLKIEGMIDENDSKIKFIPVPGKEAELPGKVYQVKVTAGRRYRVIMDSDDLDCVLLVKDSTGKMIALNDDGGGGLNSLLFFDAAKNATYKIVAMSLKGTGNFSLQVRNVGVGTPIYTVGAGGLTLKGAVGKLPAADYSVNLTAGKTYVIDMISPNQMALDPYLFLFNAAGKKLAQDDDGGGGLNAQITFTPEESGTYRIQATSFQGRGNGEFTLTVREK